MTRRAALGWYGMSLLLLSLMAVFQRVPGYMDAEYYYAGGLRIAQGQGASEPYIWNYLANPTDLPAPSFAYWMPFVSLLAAAGIKALAFLPPFTAARIPLILLAAAIPLLTARLSLTLTGKPALARIAAWLALFPGFYSAYLTTTDGFAVSMVLGGGFLLLAFEPKAAAPIRALGLGVLAGCMHLARADGLIWLAAAVLLGAWRMVRRERGAWLEVLLPFAAYGLVMLPWYARNWQVWGSLMPLGNSRALWATQYGDLMIFPPESLTPQRWLAAGWPLHIQGRWDALITHLQTLVAVQGEIALLPFILVGVWRLRKNGAVRVGGLLWLLTLAVMTVVFPYTGIQGAFFHSGASFQPLWWAVAPLGIETVVAWAARWRGWTRADAVMRFLSVLLVVTGALLSTGLFFQRVIGSDAALLWSKDDAHYRQIAAVLVRQGAQPQDRAMTFDPPLLYLVSGRSGIAIPPGDPTMLLAAARRYGARYVILEDQKLETLANLLALKDIPPQLEYLESVDSTRIFRIRP